MNASTPSQLRPAHPSFREAFFYWLKLGFISFGGPAGQIAVMHQELVEKRRWISEHRFLHGLNYCMLLPGPEAIQLAIYIAWLMHGIGGHLEAYAKKVLAYRPARLSRLRFRHRRPRYCRPFDDPERHRDRQLAGCRSRLPDPALTCQQPLPTERTLA